MLTDRPLPQEPRWPPDLPEGSPILVLSDAASVVEERLIASWVKRQAPPSVEVDVVTIKPSRRRRLGHRPDSRLVDLVSSGEPFLLPVRVAWSPFLRNGQRSVSWIDLLRLGDPRDPDALRQRVILARWPDRATIVIGNGAFASELIDEFQGSREGHGTTRSLAEFVTHKAWLALEQAERRLRGNRYKVPKFVHDEILSREDFRREAIAAGAKRGLSGPVAIARARHYVREIAANHSPFLIDLIANAIHWIYRQGYGGLIYDRQKVAEIAALGDELPLAFLPSHRSNLDRLSLQFLKWENDLPPNHTAGGINMNFFPIGPLIRRTGVFFIRRSFKENHLYKYVLRVYLDYLVEKRFPLEWYLEGGRSRSGKLLPPRLGLLSYVVGSWQRGMADDILLVPVSIVYDQIQDVGAYASEARGAKKEKESFSWAFGAVRSLRRRYGNIHVRFADPISVAKSLPGGSEVAEEGSVDLAKLAFEVMYRISQVTPITPAAVISIALLSADDRAQSIDELARVAEKLDSFIEEHNLPTTEPLRLEDPDEVRRVLDLLAEHGNVTRFQGSDDVFYMDPVQTLRAAYYRNVVVHHFVPRGIAELALAGSRKPETFWEEVFRLRDLLKFEFFFPEKDEFRELIANDLELSIPGWDENLPKSRTLLKSLDPRVAAWAVVPFLESYLVLADELAAHGDNQLGEDELINAAMKRGEEYRLKGKVSADSVSTVAFRQALSLANNRRLLEAGTAKQRVAFAREVTGVLERAEG